MGHTDVLLGSLCSQGLEDLDQPTVSNAVEHPAHYGGDTIHETIKCLEAWGLTNNAYRFNAIKYLSRAGKKDDTVQGMVTDLRKAIWYAQREIEVLESGR